MSVPEGLRPAKLDENESRPLRVFNGLAHVFDPVGGAGNATDAAQVWTGGRDRNSDCMFLCGVMWCGFGRQDAGKELLRVATSMHPEMRVPARAMWRRVPFA